MATRDAAAPVRTVDVSELPAQLPLIMGQVLGAGAGAPAAGPYVLGDTATDVNGVKWTCTVAGTPGSWCSEPISGQTVIGSAAWAALGGVANGQLPVVTLPIGAELTSMFYVPTVLYTDAAPPLGASTLSAGLTGTPIEILLAAGNAVDDAAAAINIPRVLNGASMDGTGRGVWSMVATTAVIAELTIGGGKFLNAITAGSVTFYYTYIIHSV